ncbi:MAG: glycosyltransferase [Patescibacteria group bacterium]
MKLSKNSNVLIISHFSKRAMEGGGPPQEIRDYLLPKVKRIYYIEHPFPYSKDHRSSMTTYEDGILRKQIFTPEIFGPEALFYIFDTLITFYFLIKAWVRFDLCIALDNLNTVSVLPFKKLGLIKKLVFYTIDYTPLRFKNKILNNIYHLIDRVACYNADAIWILSNRMITARKQNGVDTKRSAKNITLPMGANLSRINVLPIEKTNRYDIVFAGILLEKQGVQLILDSLPMIILKIPKVRFIIIGQGEYEQTLKDLTISLKINNHVIFEGFVKNHKDVENILARSAIGVAPYIPSPDNYTFYTDPGKPKLYLGCGLPVVITDVPAIARVIKSQKAGIIADYAAESFTKALVELLSNDALYKTYRENAIKLSKTYNTNTLIAEALDKTN